MESEFFRSRLITVQRRHLPHWTTDEGTYFVTFRLQDSLPIEVSRRIEKKAFSHRLADRFLDRGLGSCILRDPKAADVVEGALRFFNDQRYVLHAYAIMPNHVHVAFRTRPGISLPRLMQSWKGFTARAINKSLGREGTLWQDERYDTLIHDRHDLDRVIEYIARNPGKAGLGTWKWMAVLDQRFQFSEGESEIGVT